MWYLNSYSSQSNRLHFWYHMKCNLLHNPHSVDLTIAHCNAAEASTANDRNYLFSQGVCHFSNGEDEVTD